MHNKRFLAYGRTGPAESVKKTGWIKNGNGYIHRWTTDAAGKGKVVYQHREVMESFMGRKLLKSENVHHVNGVRDDNRIENLELWVSPQPSGQRLTDLIDWVVDNYREEVICRLG